MEKRNLLTVMLLMMLVAFAWQPLFRYLGHQFGWDTSPPKPAETTTTTTTTTTEQQTAPTTTPGATVAATQSGPALPAAAAAGLRVASATQTAQPVVIGSDARSDPTYRMAVRINPQGAGIDSVLLNEFKKEARKDDPYVFQEPYSTDPTHTRPLATRTITVNGKPIDLAAAQWTLESSNRNTATYSATIIGDDAQPVARVRKTFQLPDSSDPGKGYELVVSHSIQNLTDQPLRAAGVINGPNVPPKEQDRGGDRQILAGYLADGYVVVEHDMLEAFSKDKPSKTYTKDSSGHPSVWTGTGSVYFNAVLRPLPIDPSAQAPTYLDKVEATLINPDHAVAEQQVAITFATTEFSIAPGASQDLSARAFFGPRQRSLLNSDYYAAANVGYDKTLVLTSGPCAKCTFDWLIDALVSLLRAFHFIFRDWGLAIIALVVLVRAVLHPITKRSQISMARMGKMAPEMERLKKKYGDNKEELTKAMWELQKEQGVGPYLGCLPMFLQMPIWIALWQALQTTFELRQAPFLWGYTWIDDLSKPDTLIPFPRSIDLWFIHINGINVLPILMGFVFWLQMKFQPKPATMTKEQEQQQKMMQIMMPFIFPLMLYTSPSGLCLYIFTSTLIGIIESKIVRDHLKQKEEEEKAGRVIVDAGKKFKGGGDRGDSGGGGRSVKSSKPDKPKGGLLGWFTELQARAEQIRREAEKRK